MIKNEDDCRNTVEVEGTFLDKVGLTGIDDYTDLTVLETMYNKYPFVEFGVCFDSPNNPNICYAGYRLSNKLASFPHLPFVAHLSENNVKNLLQTLNLDYLKEIKWKRIQINIDIIDFLQRDSFSTFIEFIDKFRKEIHYSGQIILPENTSTRHIFNSTNLPSFIDILSDVSKGKGIHPTHDNNWPKPYYNKFGFAGGISVQSIQNTLNHLRKIAPYSNFTWIDMESSLKNVYDHKFDVLKAQLIAQLAQPFVKP